MGNTARSINNSGAPSFIKEFVDGDLTGGTIMNVNHNLGVQYLSVTVIDENDNIILPDEVTFTSTTVTAIDLNTYAPISGTWRAIIIG